MRVAYLILLCWELGIGNWEMGWISSGSSCGKAPWSEKEASHWDWEVITSHSPRPFHLSLCCEIYVSHLSYNFLFICRKRSTTAASQPKVSKRAKKDKDPNAPKRPLTAFFLFLYLSSHLLFLFLLPVINDVQLQYLLRFEWCPFCVKHCLRSIGDFVCCRDDFRKSYKEANPDSKGVKMVYSVINFSTPLLYNMLWFDEFVQPLMP